MAPRSPMTDPARPFLIIISLELKLFAAIKIWGFVLGKFRVLTRVIY